MDCSLILSGHQASIFHAGILAKRIAIDARARELDTECGWLVADQDINEPGSIRYPDLDQQGRLLRRTWQLLPTEPHVPTCVRPMGEPLPPPRISTEMPSSIQEGLDSIYEALVAAPGDNVAERFAAATERLLGARLKTPCTVVFASRLFETPIGREILERIGSEPFACVRTWNEAVRSVPRSARELRIEEGDADATEAPVWALDERGRRRPGTIRDVRRALAGEQQVLPRAFLMTAIVRAGLCTEMIHGTGGAQYELVTRSWASAFLGIELAPISIVTETVHLPLGAFVPLVPEVPSIEEIRRLEHDPWPQPPGKRAWLEKIGTAPRRSRQRSEFFREMHEELDTLRAPLAETISRMREERRSAVDAIALMEVAQDRSWPWPLHASNVLDELILGTG